MAIAYKEEAKLTDEQRRRKNLERERIQRNWDAYIEGTEEWKEYMNESYSDQHIRLQEEDDDDTKD